MVFDDISPIVAAAAADDDADDVAMTITKCISTAWMRLPLQYSATDDDQDNDEQVTGDDDDDDDLVAVSQTARAERVSAMRPYI